MREQAGRRAREQARRAREQAACKRASEGEGGSGRGGAGADIQLRGRETRRQVTEGEGGLRVQVEPGACARRELVVWDVCKSRHEGAQRG